MTGVMPFDFEGAPVRVIEIDEAPWFVAADVCRVLEIGNSRQALSRLDDDEKGVTTNDTLGGNQEMAVISESGLYSLILTSRKPAAKRFKKWVTSELLPTIRRTGVWLGDDDVEEEQPVVKRTSMDETDQKIRLVIEARRLWGPEAGRELWLQFNLAKVPCMEPVAAIPWEQQETTIERFLSFCTVRVEGQKTEARHLFYAYVTWCRAERERPLTKQQFGRFMSRLGFTRFRGYPYGYNGLLLKPRLMAAE